MIKKIFFTLIPACLFLAAVGQKATVEAGFEAGLNHVSALHSGIDKDYRDALNKLGTGISVKINLRKNFGLKALLLYDQYGYAYRGLIFESNTDTGLAPGKVVYTLQYLNLPVLAEYSFGNKIQFQLDAGIFFGALLGSKTVLSITQNQPPNEVTETNLDPSGRRFNFGAALGAGVQVPVSTRIKLDLHVRNCTGLINLYPSNANFSGSTKMNAFSILGGLVFKLK